MQDKVLCRPKDKDMVQGRDNQRLETRNNGQAHARRPSAGTTC